MLETKVLVYGAMPYIEMQPSLRMKNSSLQKYRTVPGTPSTTVAVRQ